MCLQNSKLSNEHVIPQSLGGILCSNFLCESCNDNFGHKIESKAKADPAIRLAISNLQTELPDLYAAMEEGQKYIVDVGPAKLVGRMRKGRIEAAGQIGDGSLIVSEENTPQTLRTMLTRDGHQYSDIERALKIYQDAPPDVPAQVSANFFIRKLHDKSAEPQLSGPEVNSLVLLKIAYEFMALLVGSAILSENPALNQIRAALQTGDEKFALRLVTRLMAPKYGVIHGICFHGNEHEARIEIRLFRRLAYQVCLPNIALQMKRVTYTHDLKSNEHWIYLPDQAESSETDAIG